MEYKKFMLEEIMNLDKLYRINLINGVSGYKSANLVGTTDRHGNQNLAIFSSVTHLGSNPPLLGMVLRPATVPRHTYENILETGYYTINHVSTGFMERAHQTSAKYRKQESEFRKTGLNPELKDSFLAPYVAESKVKAGLKLVEELEIRTNGTKLLVGKVVELYVPQNILAEDGSLDLSACDTVTISGLDTYLKPEKLARYSYARP